MNGHVIVWNDPGRVSQQSEKVSQQSGKVSQQAEKVSQQTKNFHYIFKTNQSWFIK